MATNTAGPEIVAVITAAVQSAMGGKVVAVRIKPAEIWTLANRSNLGGMSVAGEALMKRRASLGNINVGGITHEEVQHHGQRHCL